MNNGVKVKMTSNNGTKRVKEGDGCIIAMIDRDTVDAFVEGNFKKRELIQTACACVQVVKQSLIGRGDPEPIVDLALMLEFENALKMAGE